MPEVRLSSSNTLAVACLLTFCILGTKYLGCSNRIIWKIRELLHIHPLPRNLSHWAYTPTRDREVRAEDKERVRRLWLFLNPAFHLKGYILYEPKDGKLQGALVPSKSVPSSNSQVSTPQKRLYPFPRKFYMDDGELYLMISSLRVWAARDSNGNDVIIRLISGSDPSEELKVWRRLHSPELKNHPRNRSIPVLEYITFDGLTFIVMPRWDSPWTQDFATAEEILYYADCIFDYVDFLHENRIIHRDLTAHNIGINVLGDGDDSLDFPKGRCDPQDAVYAVYDFGNAVAYPLESKLDDIISTLRYGTELGQPVERNPFKVEMYWVAWTLQRYVRVTEDFIPEIGPFFDNIMESDEAHRPFAREALEQFRQLQSKLTIEQLKTPLKYRFWEKGKMMDLKE